MHWGRCGNLLALWLLLPGAVSAETDNCREAAEALLRQLREQIPERRAPSQIAIVVDDLGYSLARGSLAARLPGAVTLAVIPHSPHGTRLAELARSENKEVLVHTPMSSLAGRALDAGGLTEAMDQGTFLNVLRENLRALPQARGLNNHMGSLLTQRREQMEWLMEELKGRELFFVDSRTTHLSVAFDTAQALGVASTKRDFFLDHERDCHSVARQFTRLAGHSRRVGQAVAIAHPYPDTLELLSILLPRLPDDLELVPISRLLQRPTVSETDKSLSSQSFQHLN